MEPDIESQEEAGCYTESSAGHHQPDHVLGCHDFNLKQRADQVVQIHFGKTKIKSDLHAVAVGH